MLVKNLGGSLKMKELVDEITRTDIEILSEFRDNMKGIIANRHGKSKSFQFAMLDKNFKEAADFIEIFSDILYHRFLEGKPL